jgi:outer membrane protein TolC
LKTETLDFETAVNIALENNLSIKMSENGLQMTRNYVNPGVLMPTVSLNGNSNYTNTDVVSGPDTERHLNSASLSTSYTLFSGFYVLNSYKKFKLQYNQSELETRYTVESIISAMAQTYYSVANAEEQLELSLESLKISSV